MSDQYGVNLEVNYLASSFIQAILELDRHPYSLEFFHILKPMAKLFEDLAMNREPENMNLVFSQTLGAVLALADKLAAREIRAVAGRN